MTADVTAIINAANAVSAIKTVDTEIPDEILKYPAFYQYGENDDLNPVSLSGLSFEANTRYTCYLVGAPVKSHETFQTVAATLSAIRDSFIGKLAAQTIMVGRITSRKYIFHIGTDECPVIQMVIHTLTDQYTVTS